MEVMERTLVSVSFSFIPWSFNNGRFFQVVNSWTLQTRNEGWRGTGLRKFKIRRYLTSFQVI